MLEHMSDEGQTKSAAPPAQHPHHEAASGHGIDEISLVIAALGEGGYLVKTPRNAASGDWEAVVVAGPPLIARAFTIGVRLLSDAPT